MSNKDKILPEELLKEIATFAANIIKRDEYKDAPLRFIEGMLWGIDAGATEYAPWKVKYEQVMDILKVKHSVLYNEIKSFLDGK